MYTRLEPFNEPHGTLNREPKTSDASPESQPVESNDHDIQGRLYGCPVELTLDLLGGKWKTIILCRLKEKSMRYGELRRAAPELADKLLTRRLHELEDAGLIERQMEDGLPRYGISERGRSLAPALEALNTWGEVQGALLGARFRTARGRKGWEGRAGESERLDASALDAITPAGYADQVRGSLFNLADQRCVQATRAWLTRISRSKHTSEEIE